MSNFKASEIVPGLFIGSRFDALNENFIHEANITHIINMTLEVPCKFPDRIQYTQNPIPDIDSAGLLINLETLINLIDTVLESRSTSTSEKHPAILVHCAMGISRSASVVIAWRMRKEKENFTQAFKFVHSKREFVCPNNGFREQLALFESWGWKASGFGYLYWRLINFMVHQNAEMWNKQIVAMRQNGN
ncbi:Dual specificity protein phosphatase 1 [Nowakowskiella sp. JEL0407]|nr:Dual specificity protein phosphatase 1 [Nowakowskiella sp. JEL0407]